MTRPRDIADSINRINSSAADATAVTIDSSENVGIGETSPDSALHVNSGTANTAVTLESTDAACWQVMRDPTADIFFGNTGGNFALYTGGSERMRILSGGGLTFNGDTAAANALDDYEEGSWTPQVIRFDGSVAASIGVGAGSATYAKIGRLVTIKAWINSIANGSANGSNYWTVTGLPFTATPYSTAAKGYGSITPDGYYAGDANGQIILTSNSAPYTGSLSGSLMITLTYETNS